MEYVSLGDHSITSEENSSGVFQGGIWGGETKLASSGVHNDFEGYLAGMMAGIAAVRRVNRTKQKAWDEGIADLEAARTFVLDTLHGNHQDVRRFIKQGVERAAKLLRHSRIWKAVDKVAKQLLISGTVAGPIVT